MNDEEPADKKTANGADLASVLGMGGIMEGVTNLLSKFSDLAERGESLHKTLGDSHSGQTIHSSMGMKVRFGPGQTFTAGANRPDDASNGNAPPVAPVNAQSRKQPASSSAPPVGPLRYRDIMVDMFDEQDYLLLIAEMPGVAPEAVQLSFDQCILTIEGQSPSAHFSTQVSLPRNYAPEQVSLSSNNGVIEIRMQHGTPGPQRQAT